MQGRREIFSALMYVLLHLFTPASTRQNKTYHCNRFNDQHVISPTREKKTLKKKTLALANVTARVHYSRASTKTPHGWCPTPRVERCTCVFQTPCPGCQLICQLLCSLVFVVGFVWPCIFGVCFCFLVFVVVVVVVVVD